jgi:vacuolar-type H+-ATPase subunit C/Vma6
VNTVFCDLAARARGLAARLYTREELISLARSTNLDVFATQLRATGRTIGAFEHATPMELDRAVRRGAAGVLATLEGWAGERKAALQVIFDEDDRRNLRALIRGCFAGAASESRLRGLVPTTSLPERALGELAGANRIAELAARLTLWRHPYAEAFEAEARKNQPSLLDIEVALDRLAFRRALAGAKTADAHLTAHVRRSIDLTNAWSALLAGEPDAPFFEGGALLTRTIHQRVHKAKNRLDAIAVLASAFAPSPLRHVFTPANAARLEETALRTMERDEHRAILLDPLGSAPVLWLALRLRTVSADLTRIIWAIALQAPSDRLIEELITS